MCFQEPFKDINNDGSRTATIQTLCYVTIQEATRLLPGCWHKEAAESLDLARRAGFFPGSERSQSEQEWSLFSCQGHAGFPSAPLKINMTGLLWVCSLHSVPRCTLLSASQALSKSVLNIPAQVPVHYWLGSSNMLLVS